MAVIEVTKDNFDEVVLKSDKKVLVDFNADWCGPCQMLKPIIHSMAEETDKVTFVSVNIDEEDELAEDFGVSSIPCLVLFEGGAERDRAVGLRPKDAIIDFVGGI